MRDLVGRGGGIWWGEVEGSGGERWRDEEPGEERWRNLVRGGGMRDLVGRGMRDLGRGGGMRNLVGRGMRDLGRGGGMRDLVGRGGWIWR